MNQPAKAYSPEEFQESSFGIRSKEDLVHIFNVLRNKIYTNKILAVLREYATNACDAHIESGQPDRPIEVTLPTIQSPILKIRDFGLGMSEEEVRNTYVMYGASTKRGSKVLNGQLGLGSKSAYAYTDTYTITSWNGGQKSVYEAYIDETKLGAISLVEKEPCDLSDTGIEISLKINQQDVWSFQETAAKLYRYFTVTPILKNLNVAELEKPVYKFQGSCWGLREGTSSYYNECNIVMGNVAYPLSKQVLQNSMKGYRDWVRIESLLSCPIDFNCAVGDLNISSSREGLEYDKQTLKSLQQIFEKSISEITEQINNKIKEAKDLVEARQLYKSIVHGELSSLAGVIVSREGIKWDNKTIDNYKFIIPNINYELIIPAKDEAPERVERQPSFTTRVIQRASTQAGFRSWFLRHDNQIEINDNYKVFHQDTSEKPILRIRKYLQDHPETREAYIFIPEEGHCTLADISREMEVPEDYFIKLSTLDPLEIDREPSNRPTNTKHQKHLFRFSDSGSYSNESSYWNIPTSPVKDDEEVYYVLIDRFSPSLGNLLGRYGSSCYYMKEILDQLEELSGESIKNKIVGVKIAHQSKVKSNWIPLQNKIEQVFKSCIQKAEKDIEKNAYRSLTNLVHELRTLENITFGAHLDRISPDSEFYKLYKEYLNARDTPTSSDLTILHQISNKLRINLLDFSKAQDNAAEALRAKYQKVFNNYPLLRYLSTHQMESRAITDLVQYIKTKDKK